MSLKDDASLILIPSAYKTGEVLMQKPLPVIDDSTGNYDGTDPAVPTSLTFTRASEATRVNSEGLIEKVRTNLLTYSNTFSNGAWSKILSTVTGGQSGYDGTNNAWLLEITNPSGQLAGSPFFTAPVTLSIYAKAGTTNILRITPIGFADVTCDLSNGTFISQSGFITYSDITSVGNGWYRIQVAAFIAGGTLSGLNIVPSAYSGVAGDNVYIQDVQLEYGDIATDYIPTTSSAVSVGPVSNLPRLDYSGGATCPSLLLEPQRTNLVTFSEQLDNAVWTKLNCSVSANATTSPEGVANADKLTEDTSTGYHMITNYNLFVVDGSMRTWSVYVKKATARYCVISHGTVFSSSVNSLIFDMEAGVYTNEGTTDYFDIVHEPVNMGNGWYRIGFSSDLNSINYDNFSIGISKGANWTGNTSYTGDGSLSFYAWGAQVELGSYATSYIPTLETTVTRVADACSKTGISSFIGQTEGVLFGEFYVPQIISAGSYVRTIINDGTSLNQIAFFYYPDGRIQATSSVGGSIVVSINIPSFGLTSGTHKFAFGYKLNDYVLFIDGVNVGIDTSATVPSMSVLNLYDTSGGSMYYNQALLFKTRLPNATLASLTTL